MSGGGGFDVGAFNPFRDWGDKSGWDKFGSLSGLPIGHSIGSPSWVKEHPKEAAAAALIAATVLTAGAAAPAAGAAGSIIPASEGLGAGAAAFGGPALADGVATGAGAAAFGGAALADGAGAGLLGAAAPATDLGVAAFGPTAAQTGLLASYAPETSALTPMFTGGAPDALAGAGGSSMFGPTAGGAQSLEALQGPGHVSEMMSGMNWKKGLEGLQKAQQFAKLAQGPQVQPAGPPPAMRQQGGGADGHELAQLSALFSNPAGQEALKRILRMQGYA